MAGAMAVRREIVEVPFREGTIQALQDDKGGVFVVVRWVCEQLGLAWAPQFTKLKGYHWATVTMIVTVDPNGREREHCVIPLRALPMWLATVDVRKVAADVKEKLVAYQLEAVDVLHDYFFGRKAAEPAVKSEPTLLDQARMMVAVLERQEGLRRELEYLGAHVQDYREVADHALDVARDAQRDARNALNHANPDPGCMCLRAYCRVHGLELSDVKMSLAGKWLSAAYRAEFGCEPDNIPDQKWGLVNVYPVSLLDRWREERPGARVRPPF